MTTIPDFYTIGVYGKTEAEFFQALTGNSIDIFIDIRQRRAVRGSKYSFVNSTRLQQKLRELGIQYLHLLELAPTKEIRQIQKNADKEAKEKKVDRNVLSDVFIEVYKHKILDTFDINKFLKKLEGGNVKKAVLFCVEKEARACHRSIVADKIANQLAVSIQNL
jgi:uncharacterized protein (DUF488 family)